MKYTFVTIDNCNMCGSEGTIWGRRLNQSQGLRPKSKTGISVSVMKCVECGLIYANPLPIPENISDHYGIPPESYWTESYFTVPEGYFYGQFERMRAIVPNGKTLLDIGAGVGKVMRAGERFGLETYGIEPSVPFFERAIGRTGISSERLVNSSVEEADFPRMFDMIAFSAVLEHLYDPSGCLQKALSWLNPGGVIHIEVPDAGFLFNKLFNAYFWLARTDFVVNISPMHVPFHLYEFTETSFRKNGERLGYKIADLDRYAGSTVITPKLSKLLQPFMNATNTGDGLILYIQSV